MFIIFDFGKLFVYVADYEFFQFLISLPCDFWQEHFLCKFHMCYKNSFNVELLNIQ